MANYLFWHLVRTLRYFYVFSLCIYSTEVSYLNEDHATPLYSNSTHYAYSEAVKIILECPEDKLCSKHPVLVEQNAAFVVNLGQLDHADDIKADDCGHWIHNGRKSTKITLWKRNGVVTTVLSTSKCRKSPPDENSELYTLVRVYYTHDPHSDFKRTYYYLYGEYD